jgi:aspartate aminotransferase-like enzyme
VLSKPLYFAPGPIRIPDKVKKSLLEDPPYFTTKAFSKLLQETRTMLMYVMDQTRSHTPLIGYGSGSLGMEAAVANFFRPGECVLIIDSGKYGKHFSTLAMKYKLIPYVLTSSPGAVVPVKHVEKVLQSIWPVSGVLCQTVETTTAVRTPYEWYVKLVKERFPKALSVIDAISSIGIEPFSSTKYDVVIGASQKGLQCPPGLFFMSASEAAIERANEIASTSSFTYFSVVNEYERAQKNITTFTPSSNLIMALHAGLSCMMEIGIESIYQTTDEKARYVRDRLATYPLLSRSPCTAVTAVEMSDADSFVQECEERNLILGGGVRELKNKIFRMMHFGWDTTYEEISEAFAIIDEVSGRYWP